jgi:hypothetical protein
MNDLGMILTTDIVLITGGLAVAAHWTSSSATSLALALDLGPGGRNEIETPVLIK